MVARAPHKATCHHTSTHVYTPVVNLHLQTVNENTPEINNWSAAAVLEVWAVYIIAVSPGLCAPRLHLLYDMTLLQLYHLFLLLIAWGAWFVS